ISRKPVHETREIKDTEDEIIRRALRSAPEWMQVSYAIAMAQGCRFSETRVRLSDIDLRRGTILFHAKGGKVFETSLTPSLFPLIQRLEQCRQPGRGTCRRTRCCRLDATGRGFFVASASDISIFIARVSPRLRERIAGASA